MFNYTLRPHFIHPLEVFIKEMYRMINWRKKEKRSGVHLYICMRESKRK